MKELIGKGGIDMNHLRKLAELYGIETDYFDIWGRHISIQDEIIQNLLRCMGEYCFDDAHLKESILLKQKELSFPIPPVIVTSDRQLIITPDPEWKSAQLILTGEKMAMEIRVWTGSEGWHCSLPIDLEWGYYRLEFEIRTVTKTMVLKSYLVFSPGFCYLPEEKEFWGLNLGVYSLHTGRNQGIGDLHDLEMVGDLLRKHRGSFLGILPIHLLENRLPYGISPYYPVDRLEWNPIYLPLEWVAQILGNSGDELLFHNGDTRSEPLTQDTLLDYQKVWLAKDRVLRRLYTTWRNNPSWSISINRENFESFIKAEGDRFLHSTFYQAYACTQGWDYHSWPECFLKVNNQAIAGYIDDNREEVYYFAFLQWMMDLYLSNLSKSSDMIAFDLPVGTSPTGIESWLNQDLFIFSQRVGAPPDDFSPAGQNWGFPPANPWKDRQNHYSHFISLIRANMRYSSFLRIDHIMGLYRLFWMPEGSDARYGTYVRSFFNDLLGILALESHRNRVIVIGEDLGTVPPQVRMAMLRYRILSTRVLYFENDQQGFLPAPSEYPMETMVTIGTHDMPPLKAFLQGKDIELRKRLGLFNQTEAADHQLNRTERIKKIKTKLIEWGFLVEPSDSSRLLEALLRYMSATPSLLKVVNLDDLLGSDTQLNLPGTTSEYPNWRHQLNLNPAELEEKIQWLANYLDGQ